MDTTREAINQQSKKHNQWFEDCINKHILDDKAYIKIDKEPVFICFNSSSKLSISMTLLDLGIIKTNCIVLDEETAKHYNIDKDSILLVDKKKVSEYIEKYFNSFESR